MPARPPRLSLKHEITVSLAVKVAALAAMGLILFGPQDRIHPSGDAMESRLVGARP